MAKIDFYVFGVPSGENIWQAEEKNDGSEFFGKFYTDSVRTSAPQLLIEIAKQGDQTFCYYSFLVGNTLAHDGRDGSYFGMSIRTDIYIKSALWMHQLMDSLFRSYIVGPVLSAGNGGKLKYTISKFDEASKVLSAVFDRIVADIKNTQKSNIIQLPANSLSSGAEVFNLAECTDDAVAQTLIKQHKCVSLSIYAPSQTAHEAKARLEQQLNKLRQDCETSVNQARQAAEKDLNSKNEELQALRADKANLTAEIQKLKAEQTNLKTKQEINATYRSIEQQVSKLVELWGSLTPNESSNNGESPKPRRRFNLWGVCSLCIGVVNLIVVIILAILTFLGSGAKNKANHGANESTASKASSQRIEAVQTAPKNNERKESIKKITNEPTLPDANKEVAATTEPTKEPAAAPTDSTQQNN